MPSKVAWRRGWRIWLDGCKGLRGGCVGNGDLAGYQGRRQENNFVIVLIVNASTWILSSASSPLMTSVSPYSKHANFSFAADSSSNKPQWRAKHWQVAGKWAPLPIKKKTHHRDQTNGWNPSPIFQSDSQYDFTKDQEDTERKSL